MKTRSERYIKRRIKELDGMPFNDGGTERDAYNAILPIIKGEKYSWMFDKMDQEDLETVLFSISEVMALEIPMSDRVLKFWDHLMDGAIEHMACDECSFRDECHRDN